MTARNPLAIDKVTNDRPLLVMECRNCGGVMVEYRRKRFNAYMDVDGKYYYKRSSKHSCIERLSRGLGPKRKEQQ